MIIRRKIVWATITKKSFLSQTSQFGKISQLPKPVVQLEFPEFDQVYFKSGPNPATGFGSWFGHFNEYSSYVPRSYTYLGNPMKLPELG
jgi:hypothetical protein